MKYELEITNKFKKDLKAAIKRGYDLRLLQTVVDLLCSGESLPAVYKDHNLSGN